MQGNYKYVNTKIELNYFYHSYYINIDVTPCGASWETCRPNSTISKSWTGQEATQTWGHWFDEVRKIGQTIEADLGNLQNDQHTRCHEGDPAANRVN